MFPSWSGREDRGEGVRGSDAAGQFTGARGRQVSDGEHGAVRPPERAPGVFLQSAASVHGPAGHRDGGVGELGVSFCFRNRLWVERTFNRALISSPAWTCITWKRTRRSSRGSALSSPSCRGSITVTSSSKRRRRFVALTHCLWQNQRDALIPASKTSTLLFCLTVGGGGDGESGEGAFLCVCDGAAAHADVSLDWITRHSSFLHAQTVGSGRGRRLHGAELLSEDLILLNHES